MRPAILALGANLGDPAAALQGAVDALAGSEGIRVITASSVYLTDPVGGPEQGVYSNAVVRIETDLTPEQLLARVQVIELEFGRVRDVRWGPRTLDIDVIDVDGQVSDDPVLTLPHPRAHERGFVIVPWREIEPDATLVGHGRISDLPVGRTGVRRTSERLVVA